MGNGLRHSFGHMCGGETSKDLQDDVEQPVDRPKESKKKSKKSKKGKKVRNGKLGSIKEENELQTETLPNGNSEPPPAVDSDEKSKDDLNDNEDVPEEAFNKVELHITDESSSAPVITINCASGTISAEEDEKRVEEVSSDIPMSDSYVNEEETAVDGNLQEYNDGDNISLTSTTEEEPNIMMCTFKPIETEILGIEEADEVFQTAFTNYELFVEGGNNFQDKILEFQQAVESEKKSTDFLTLWHQYKTCAEESISKDPVDKIDMSSDLRDLESAGLELTEIIENVKPIIYKCADDADNIDAIKCAKDQMLEGEELMTTDKFSAPGKYRRNMSRLKKCTKQITEIELEASEILRCLRVYFAEYGHEKLQAIDNLSLARESIIIPDEKNNDCDLEDIFSNLSQESIPIVLSDYDENSLSDDNEDRPPTPVPPVDLQVRPDDHLSDVSSDSHSDHEINNAFVKMQYDSDDDCQDSMQVGGDLVKTVNVSVEDITADEPIESSTPENELAQTFVIKSVPETMEAGDILAALSSPTRRCHTPPLQLDLEPDHNTLEYGNYVFVDPSTGDIQVMRNRSRSLDSLVSMASSRSSISRFGSFEFVTDFEINIAEKNQEMMKGH